MKKFFSTEPIWYDGGLFVVRLILGIFMTYHGWEIFDKVKMNEYAGWDTFKTRHLWLISAKAPNWWAASC